VSSPACLPVAAETALAALRKDADDAPLWRELFHIVQHDRALRLAAAREVEALATASTAAQIRAGVFLFLATLEPRYLARVRDALDSSHDDDFDVRVALFRALDTVALYGHARTHREALEHREALQYDELLAGQARRIGFVPSAPPSGDLRRVVVVASEVYRLSHPPTRVAWEHLRLFRGMGLETMLVSANELWYPDMGSYACADLVPLGKPREKSEWVQSLGHDVKVWAADATQPFAKRWPTLLSRIDAFRPDAVLYIGLGSPMQWLLHPHYPLLNLCTSGYPLGAPCDASLLSSPASWPDVGNAVEYPWRVSVPQQVVAAEPADKARLGIAPDAVVLVTAGARLNWEIDGPWASRMADLLGRHPSARWVLIGQASIPEPLSAVRDSVMCLGPQSSLGPWLKGADIYVNPPRLGGGLSVTEAMACGLCTVSLANCDGGDKLGDWASATEEAYFDALEALMDSRPMRLQRGQDMRERYLRCLDASRAAKALESAIDRARAAFCLRGGLA
jgi:hypothetical protein